MSDQQDDCSCQRAQTANPALHCPVHGPQDDLQAAAFPEQCARFAYLLNEINEQQGE